MEKQKKGAPAEAAGAKGKPLAPEGLKSDTGSMTTPGIGSEGAAPSLVGKAEKTPGKIESTGSPFYAGGPAYKPTESERRTRAMKALLGGTQSTAGASPQPGEAGVAKKKTGSGSSQRAWSDDMPYSTTYDMGPLYEAAMKMMAETGTVSTTRLSEEMGIPPKLAAEIARDVVLGWD